MILLYKYLSIYFLSLNQHNHNVTSIVQLNGGSFSP